MAEAPQLLPEAPDVIDVSVKGPKLQEMV